MGKLTATYVRENGEVLAFFEKRLIAQGTNFAKVEETAVEYLDNLGKKRNEDSEEKEKKAATHVVTPNGLKGEILSRVPDLYGESELTVRFENGRIARLAAHGDSIKYSNERTASAPSNPIEAMRQELDADYDRDKQSLVTRIATLDGIVRTASTHLAQGASYTDESALHKLVLVAEAEKQEVSDVVEYLKQADAETFQPTNPGYNAVEQAEMGRSKGDSWLDHTMQEMIGEAEDINFDKVLAEEPAQFAADLDTGTLGDQGSTAEMALAHIKTKTAAFEGPEVESYRDMFVAATEMARRAELADRKQANHKQAATEKEEMDQGPDEGLFL